MRDYSRAFRVSLTTLEEKRIKDFLLLYTEAMEDAKKRQAAAKKQQAGYKKSYSGHQWG